MENTTILPGSPRWPSRYERVRIIGGQHAGRTGRVTGYAPDGSPAVKLELDELGGVPRAIITVEMANIERGQIEPVFPR